MGRARSPPPPLARSTILSDCSSPRLERPGLVDLSDNLYGYKQDLTGEAVLTYDPVRHVHVPLPLATLAPRLDTAAKPAAPIAARKANPDLPTEQSHIAISYGLPQFAGNDRFFTVSEKLAHESKRSLSQSRGSGFSSMHSSRLSSSTASFPRHLSSTIGSAVSKQTPSPVPSPTRPHTAAAVLTGHGPRPVTAPVSRLDMETQTCDELDGLLDARGLPASQRWGGRVPRSKALRPGQLRGAPGSALRSSTYQPGRSTVVRVPRRQRPSSALSNLSSGSTHACPPGAGLHTNVLDQLLEFEARIRSDIKSLETAAGPQLGPRPQAHRPSSAARRGPPDPSPDTAPDGEAAFPSCPTQLKRLLQTHLNSCNYPQALECIEWGLRLPLAENPDLLAHLHHQRAIIRHRHTGDFDGAESDYQKAISFNPHSGAVYRDRADLRFYILGRDFDALDDYSSAIGCGVSQADVYNNRGEIRWKHKNALGAWEDFDQASALQPDHPVASLNLEVTCKEMGGLQLEKARTQLAGLPPAQFKPFKGRDWKQEPLELTDESQAGLADIAKMLGEQFLLELRIIGRSKKEEQLPKFMHQATFCKTHLVELGVAGARIMVQGSVESMKTNKFGESGVFFEVLVGARPQLPQRRSTSPHRRSLSPQRQSPSPRLPSPAAHRKW
uniref:Uncharacterized protein n=1 Tax=Eutreptiella gymnastica TaxID=73025 RepID=A0A7S1NQW7_9EUGL|mmetsp:Transcript_67047/g.119061  ORF Transcript_67047/g.119061 Transcript_67047/m.119061 type:complete len:669 (+) Transcript_67047:134-2140(+)